MQELATAHIENIAAKALILNNQHLGMVVQWEDRFYSGNRGHTYLGDPENMKQIYPDFIAMAKSFNVPCERVIFKKICARPCSGCWTPMNPTFWMSSLPIRNMCCHSSRPVRRSRK